LENVPNDFQVGGVDEYLRPAGLVASTRLSRSACLLYDSSLRLKSPNTMTALADQMANLI
jgi:hypothetical protein